jgi:hypothetical protein
MPLFEDVKLRVDVADSVQDSSITYSALDDSIMRLPNPEYVNSQHQDAHVCSIFL